MLRDSDMALDRGEAPSRDQGKWIDQRDLRK